MINPHCSYTGYAAIVPYRTLELAPWAMFLVTKSMGDFEGL